MERIFHLQLLSALTIFCRYRRYYLCNIAQVRGEPHSIRTRHGILTRMPCRINSATQRKSVTGAWLTAHAPPLSLLKAVHHTVHMSRNDRSSTAVSRPSNVREQAIVRCDECVNGTDDFPANKATRTAQAERIRMSPPALPPRLPIWEDLGILSP